MEIKGGAIPFHSVFYLVLFIFIEIYISQGIF